MPIDMTACGDPKRRHDFILMFDVTSGNPNGDPDMDNTPRQDPETNHGLVTDVCLKRKVRNFVALTGSGVEGRDIYVQDKGIYLNDLHKEAQQTANIPEAQAKEPRPDDLKKAREWMCRRYYDIRMFGAVMSTRINAGQVRGPAQMTFARSFDPVMPMEVAITRVALTDESEKKAAARGASGSGAEAMGESSDRFARSGTIGRKMILPYGLYLGYGFFTPAFAEQTNVSREDLELFWTALMNMWDVDHSASRGLMACQGLHVFSHADPKGLGNAPAQSLFKRLNADLKRPGEPPRRYDDYDVALDRDALPDGVTLTSLVEN